MSQKSETFVHSELAFEIFVVVHNPPLTPAAHTLVLEVKFPSSINALVLPAWLLGPLSVQLISDFLSKYDREFNFASLNFIASKTLSEGTVLVFGSLVIKKSW